MFGNLARWLRLLGYDATWANEYDRDEVAATDDFLLEVGIKEGRTIITRDKQFAEKCRARAHPVCQVMADALEESLQELKDCLALELQFDADASRCPKCNAPLGKVPDKREVRDRVQPGTYERYSEFWECPACEQVYWVGKHFEDIQEILEHLE